MDSLAVNEKVEMLVRRFIFTLQKRSKLGKERMKNEDYGKGSGAKFLSNKGCPESYSPDAGSVGEDLSFKGRSHKIIKLKDQVNLHVAKPVSENQINLGEESMKNEACNVGSAENDHDQAKPGKPVTPTVDWFDMIDQLDGPMQWRTDGLAEACSRMVPSSASGTTSPEIKKQDGATISRQGVPGQKVLIVRPRAVVGQPNPEVEVDEKIAEERAVCRICFKRFAEENILKTVCGCDNGFMHEDCASNWSKDQRCDNKCDYCEKDAVKIPVTLLTNPSSTENQPEGKTSGWFSRFQRKAKHCKKVSAGTIMKCWSRLRNKTG